LAWTAVFGFKDFGDKECEEGEVFTQVIWRSFKLIGRADHTTFGDVGMRGHACWSQLVPLSSIHWLFPTIQMVTMRAIDISGGPSLFGFT
jgi:hypothetical protein